MLLMSPDAKGGLENCLDSVVLVPAYAPRGSLIKLPILSI